MLQKYLNTFLLFIKDTKRRTFIRTCWIVFFPLLFASCMPTYKSHIKTYRQIFANNNSAAPDYSNLIYWAAHPDKQDPSDSIAASLKTSRKAMIADVFFIHPTTYLKNKKHPISMNPSIADPVLNAKTDYSTILYQASVFNGSCLVYAPRYRQAHIAAFFMKDTMAAKTAFELAYLDIKTAFEYYIQHHHNGRPIIIAAHSQGTLLAGRLLKEFFENKPLSKQLVVAYLWGMPIPPDFFTQLSLCKDSAQTGCFAGWRLFKKGYMPGSIKKEKYIALSVNPISWRSDNIYMDRSKQLGAVLFNFSKAYTHTQGALIHKGVVWVDRPKFPFSFLYTKRNYHAGDINLFYLDVRKNIEQRINSFLASPANTIH